MSNGSYLGVKIVILCLLWYVTSAVNNVVGKLVLQSFAYPITVTLFQFSCITIFLIPALRCLPSAKREPRMSWTYYFKLIIPLAFGKFFASVTSHISLWAVPVSYAHTIKASMPLFVVLLSRVLLGERQTSKIYFSLIPIILGVLIASVTELDFNITGLVAALVSIFIFSLQNIYSKIVLKETSIHHLRLLHILARHALVMFIPFWIYHDLLDILYSESNSTVDGWAIGSLLFLDGLCNFLQNVIAFTVLSLVTPLTYSICNASKRIAVIVCSILMLKNPVTYTNIFGMSLAIFGVFYYNKAKIDARNQPILPTKTSTTDHFNEKKLNHNKSSDTNLLLRFIDNDQKSYISSALASPNFTPKSIDKNYASLTQNYKADYQNITNGFSRGNSHLRYNTTVVNGDKRNGHSSSTINMMNI